MSLHETKTPGPTSSRQRKTTKTEAPTSALATLGEAVRVTRTLGELYLDPMNVRANGERLPDLKVATVPFVASIEADGVLVPLIVRKGGGVIAGRRRLAALLKLAKANRILPEHDVTCDEFDLTDAQARELSLVENVHREGMHPVEEHRAFASLKSAGMPVAEIAARHGMTSLEVRQVLTLGELAPVILDAWKDGKIAKETVAAFQSAGDDHDRQVAIFNKLKKSNGLNAWQVRKEFLGDDREMNRHLKFVGKDAYVAAGGTFVDDLYARMGSPDVVLPNQVGIISNLVAARFATECAKLLNDGWGWAERDTQGARHYLDHNPKAKPDKTRGCFVDMDHTGALVVLTGFSKGKKVAATGAATKPKKKPGTISASLERDLEGQHASAVKIALVRKVGSPKLCGLLSSIVSTMIHPDTMSAMPEAIKRNLAEIADHIESPVMNAALADEFNAKDYFGRCGRVLALKALEAMKWPKGLKGKPLDKRPTGELAKLAVAGASETGWLPKELRAAGYRGPGR